MDVKMVIKSREWMDGNSLYKRSEVKLVSVETEGNGCPDHQHGKPTLPSRLLE